jgi:hypothetical protein
MTARAEHAGLAEGPDQPRSVELTPERESAAGARQNRHVPDLFQRHPDNPLLTAADWPYAAHTVFNPGANTTPVGRNASPGTGRGPPRHLSSDRCSQRRRNQRLARGLRAYVFSATRAVPRGVVGRGGRPHRATRDIELFRGDLHSVFACRTPGRTGHHRRLSHIRTPRIDHVARRQRRGLVSVPAVSGP